MLVGLLATLLLGEAIARAVIDPDPPALSHLNTEPGEGVFVFGNSMFQTGIDFAQLREQSGREVDFDYHNGHYSSLWYLIASKALPEVTSDPELTVWGFRPAFAADPAFRTNQPNDNDLLEPGDDTYLRLTVDSGDPPAAWAIGTRLRGFVDDHSRLFGTRSDAQEVLADSTAEVGVELAGLVRPEDTADFRARFDAGETTVTDEILRIATRGEVQLAEEKVDDDVGDFISGPSVRFEGSFIPEIADEIASLGLNQLVIIWKPAAAAAATNRPDDDLFVSDAIDYFESNEIPYVNLYDEPTITIDMYASGDHYNEAGRRHITTLLADILRSENP
ncbi:MAG: hypothetical protein R8J94_09805 [Acidimicrobiia bacterium]|nr:hypothetical protein [Acidimicrobiia bacterium]